MILQRPSLLIPGLPTHLQEMVCSTPQPQNKFSCLEDGNTLTLAWQLRGLLVEMFGNHQLLMTPKVCVHFMVVCDDTSHPAAEVLPSYWKQEVNGLRIHMAEMGIYKGSFVIWGPILGFGEIGIYQPYIILAGLGGSVSMKTLLEKKLLGEILGFLRIWVVDPEAFFGLKKVFGRVKRELELICPVPRRNATTINRENFYDNLIVRQDHILETMGFKARQSMQFQEQGARFSVFIWEREQDPDPASNAPR